MQFSQPVIDTQVDELKSKYKQTIPNLKRSRDCGGVCVGACFLLFPIIHFSHNGSTSPTEIYSTNTQTSFLLDSGYLISLFCHVYLALGLKPMILKLVCNHQFPENRAKKSCSGKRYCKNTFTTRFCSVFFFFRPTPNLEEC